MLTFGQSLLFNVSKYKYLRFFILFVYSLGVVGYKIAK